MTSNPAKSRLATTLVGSVIALAVVMGLFQAVANQADGVPMLQTLLQVYSSKVFWLDLMAPLTVFFVGFQLLWGHFWKWIARPGSKETARLSSYNRLRLVSTAGFLIYAGGIGYSVWRQLTKEAPRATTLATSSLGLVYGVLLAFYVVLAWVRPSAEKAKALDTGDHSRVNDERHTQVVMRSAQSTVWIALGVMLGAGSLSETLFYRSMPIRSFAAAAALLVIWQLTYIYWDKRM